MTEHQLLVGAGGDQNTDKHAKAKWAVLRTEKSPACGLQRAGCEDAG